jgi:hypothetical protein
MLSMLGGHTQNAILQSSGVSTTNKMTLSMEHTTNDSTIKKSTKGQSTIRTSELSSSKEIKDLNKKVWRSWWKSYLERCDMFI